MKIWNSLAAMKARENKASINQMQNRTAFKASPMPLEKLVSSHMHSPHQTQAFFLGQRHKPENSRAKPAENANKLNETTA